MNNIRYLYIRNANYEPCGCIAITVSRHSNRVEYGYSVRHPNDAKDSNGKRLAFDRKAARALALQRLVEAPGLTFITKDATQHEVSSVVLQHLIASKNTPARAVRFAKRWLDVSHMVHGL